MAQLASHIVVGRDEVGAPRIVIDGQIMPWFTSGIHVTPPSLEGVASLTVTLLAENIIIEETTVAGPRAKVVDRSEAFPGRYRCGHQRCDGHHDSPTERCC